MQVAHFVASSKGWRQDRHGCQSQLADCRRTSESVPLQPSMICCTSYLAKLCAEGESASRADCKRHHRRHPISARSAGTRVLVESHNPISKQQSGCCLQDTSAMMTRRWGLTPNARALGFRALMAWLNEYA